MKNLSENFQEAIKDYVFLLEKNYPQKGILKLVGDRYKLSGIERTMLYRGITSCEKSSGRIKKKSEESSIAENQVNIDSLNQLLTITSYLNGSLVFISNDGFLRDASEIHGKMFRTGLLEKAVEMILQYANTLDLHKLIFFIDKQVTKHELVSNTINKIALQYNLSFEIKISDSVDHILKETETGIIATSDSQIIDKSKVKIFDLARNTLKYFFNPNFIDLDSYQKK